MQAQAIKPTSVRLSTDDKALINRAASISGTNQSDFIVRSAREVATNTILDAQVIVTNADQFNEIMDYLNSDERNERLEAAIAKSKANPLW